MYANDTLRNPVKDANVLTSVIPAELRDLLQRPRNSKLDYPTKAATLEYSVYPTTVEGNDKPQLIMALENVKLNVNYFKGHGEQI